MSPAGRSATPRHDNTSSSFNRLILIISITSTIIIIYQSYHTAVNPPHPITTIMFPVINIKETGMVMKMLEAFAKIKFCLSRHVMQTRKYFSLLYASLRDMLFKISLYSRKITSQIYQITTCYLTAIFIFIGLAPQ